LPKRPNNETSKSIESNALTIRSTKVSSALELLNKRDRELRSEFLVEGAHAVEEVIKSHLAKAIFVTKEFSPIIRVADAAGADLVIFAGTCVDPHNGKVVRASAGSMFNVKVRQADDVAETLTDLVSTNHSVFITDGKSETQWKDVDLKKPLAWVLGNEAWGVSDLDAPVGQRVSIPIYGRAESLNVATAAALCLYETAKSRAGN